MTQLPLLRRQPNPSRAAPPASRWRALVLACALAMVPTVALAGAMPEVLLVVDTSQSMQYRLGADVAPQCMGSVGNDQKSRWTLAREIIGGTFLDYRCTEAALPAQPEALNPPKTINTLADCIPGLGSSYGGGGAAGPVSPTSMGQISSSAPSGSILTFQDGFKMKDTKMPFFEVPLVPGRTFSNLTMTFASSASSPQVVLTIVRDAVPSDANDFKCEADGPDRLEVTPATLLTAGQVSFSINTAGQAAILAHANAGKSNIYFAIVPAHSSTNPSCNMNSARSNTYDTSDVGTFDKNNANPVFAAENVQQCPAEGPSTHSTALGVDDLGAISGRPAGRDGLLDVFGAAAKFALLTTDQVFNQGTNGPAGWSFGPTASAPWGTINLGMNDPFGVGTPAVPITRADTLAARGVTYDAIQASLQSIKPYGPTPLGQQLRDAYHYYATDPYRDDHFKPVSQDPDGDPYLTCRSKFVVVISDGGSNAHDGVTDGRAEALQAAADLKALGVNVYVVAVGHPAANPASGPPAADLQFLNDLALAGGTLAATVADSPQDAIAAISDAIQASQLDNQVYSRPVTATATGSVTDVLHGFYSLSTFDISQPLRTRGTIEQRVFQCGSACQNPLTPGVGQVCEVIDYGTRLKAKGTQRKLYGHKAGGRLTLNGTNFAPADLGIGNVGLGPQLTLTQNLECIVSSTFDLSTNPGRAGYRDHVMDMLWGAAGSCRANHPLGAVSRSQMAVLEPADRTGYREPSFLTYIGRDAPASADYGDSVLPGSRNRPTMLFAATHDGLLHAFRTDRSTAITTKFLDVAGDEMWAWLPKFSLRRISQLKLVTLADASYLGGSITTGHVQLSRTGLEAGADDLARKWRAVVIAGAGTAGSGYTALDVTSPDDPRLLWEINPESRCYGAQVSSPAPGPTCLASTSYQNMGRSTARPILTNLYFRYNNAPAAQRAVVIVPMGLPPSQASVTNFGVEGQGGRGLYIIDLETGALIRELDTASMDKSGMPMTVADTDLGYFAADIACVPAGTGQIATRCFAGDTKGMLWRIDLTDQDPNNWTFKFFHDAYGGPDVPAGWQKAIDSADRAPVASAPSLSVNAAGNIVIIYGTGSGDDESSSTRLHTVHSLTETFVAQQDGVMPQVSVNWQKRLDAHERFIGPPVVFALHAYWSSWEVAQDGACVTGVGKIWGARYDRSQSPSAKEDLWGAFPNPSAPSTVSANLDFVELGPERPSPVDIQPLPACRGTCSPTDVNCVASAATSGLSAGKPSYQVQVATPTAATQGRGLDPILGAQPAVGTATQSIPQPRTTAVITGWDLLLE